MPWSIYFEKITEKEKVIFDKENVMEERIRFYMFQVYFIEISSNADKKTMGRFLAE